MKKSSVLTIAASLIAMSASSSASASDLMSVSSTALNFGRISAGTTSDLTLTLHSHSIFKIKVVGVSGLASGFNFKGGSFPGSGGNCSDVIKAGQSCNLVLEYAPTNSGLNSSNTITVHHKYLIGNGTRSTTITLSGQSKTEFAVLRKSANNFMPGASAESVAVINGYDLTHVRDIALPNGMASQMLTMDNKLYVGDQSTVGIPVFDLNTGSKLTTIPNLSPRSMVISPDRKTLYSVGFSGLDVVNLQLNGVTNHLSIPTNDQPVLLKISPDGGTLGYLSFDGSSSWLTTYNTNGMGQLGRMPFNQNIPGCSPEAFTMAFTTNTTVTAWDNNCDQVYQLFMVNGVVTTRNQYPVQNRDSAASSFQMVNDPALNAVFGLKEDTGGNVEAIESFNLTTHAAAITFSLGSRWASTMALKSDSRHALLVTNSNGALYDEVTILDLVAGTESGSPVYMNPVSSGTISQILYTQY